MSTSDQIIIDAQSILPGLQEAMQQGIQYRGELFNSFVVYEIVKNSIVAGGILVIMSAASFLLYKYVLKHWNKWEVYDDESWFLTLYFIFMIPAFSALVANSSNLLKAIFLPELRLIEILSNLN